MSTRKNTWAWPDVHTGVGTRTTGASAAFSDRMDAEDVTDQRFIGAFEHWNSGYGRHQEDAALDVQAPRMQKLFEHWNSMSRRANSEPQLQDRADFAGFSDESPSTSCSALVSEAKPRPDLLNRMFDESAPPGPETKRLDWLVQRECTEQEPEGIRICQAARSGPAQYHLGTEPPLDPNWRSTRDQDIRRIKLQDISTWFTFYLGAKAVSFHERNASRLMMNYLRPGSHIAGLMRRAIGAMLPWREKVQIDLEKLLRNCENREELGKRLDAEILEIQNYVQSLKPRNEPYHIMGSVMENLRTAGNLGNDWHDAVGGFVGYASAEVTVRCEDGQKVVEGTVAFQLWDPYEYEGLHHVGGLGHLHDAGLAREFLTWGEIERKLYSRRYHQDCAPPDE